MYKLCGNCLHHVNSHSTYNGIGKFMYCSSCNKLCDIEEFNIENKPSDVGVVMELGFKREYAPYKSKEVKE